MELRIRIVHVLVKSQNLKGFCDFFLNLNRVRKHFVMKKKKLEYRKYIFGKFYKKRETFEAIILKEEYYFVMFLVNPNWKQNRSEVARIKTWTKSIDYQCFEEIFYRKFKLRRTFKCTHQLVEDSRWKKIEFEVASFVRGWIKSNVFSIMWDI